MDRDILHQFSSSATTTKNRHLDSVIDINDYDDKHENEKEVWVPSMLRIRTRKKMERPGVASILKLFGKNCY